MILLTCRLKSYIQPFERELALRELASLAGSNPEPAEQHLAFHDAVSRGETKPTKQVSQLKDCLAFAVKTNVAPDILAEKLAYWEAISGEKNYLSAQVLREATANVVRNGVQTRAICDLVRLNLPAMLPNRRFLRYGTHGLHEYRGKFFPQLVKSLINISGLQQGAVVADPMCGSGTTAVEALLAGCHAVGLDRNPLSRFVAQTKCAVLSSDPDTLITSYERVRARLLSPRSKSNDKMRYFNSLPESDQRYLNAWFSVQVLADLDSVAQQINQIQDVSVRDFMWVALSNIIRRVSWQKEDDLRVRKEVRLDEEIDPIREYLEELGRSVRVLAAFIYQTPGVRLGRFDIRDGDARSLDSELPERVGKIDAVITSPPYATALPYLDTDRLSLCYLGLLSRPMHRPRDLEMIGNREISDRQRSHYLQEFRRHKEQFPGSITDLIETVDRRNSNCSVGFRRRNLPALLAKYFMDMKRVLTGISRLLKPQGAAYLVVGSNHTIAGGERVHIDTPSLLANIATDIGFRLESRLPMEMLVSRDIFRKNAGESEEILFLRK